MAYNVLMHFSPQNVIYSVTDIKPLFPRNPQGRTGMVGRGLLGRWGPNHAADPIVTRYTIIQSRPLLS